MSRQDQSQITVMVDGRSLGVWDKRDGGEVDSEETKYRPGGMGQQKALGGNTSTGNVTVERLYDLDRGDHDLCRRLMARAGKARMVVTDQPLDENGNAWGTPMVWRGVMKTVTPPNRDSESSDAATWSLEMSSEGAVG